MSIRIPDLLEGILEASTAASERRGAWGRGANEADAGAAGARPGGSTVTGQPNLVTSRRRQHELLRSWSTWAMTSILLDPSEVAHVRESGWSGTHHSDPTTGERIAGTTDGLGFGLDESWHNPRELIAWPDIEAIAESVPTEVREQLVELRDRLREHRKAYPRFAASAAAIGCGPIVEGQPLTPRQEAYVRELQEFEASGVLPAWEQKHAALDAERLQLHDQALAAGLDHEPVDLLELLEDQHLGRPAAAPPADQAHQTRAHDETTKTGTHHRETPMRIRRRSRRRPGSARLGTYQPERLNPP